jgi:hypothetical protein
MTDVEQLAQAWPAIVGAATAEHSRPIAFTSMKVLVVATDSSAASHDISFLQRHITKEAQALGCNIDVFRIRFDYFHSQERVELRREAVVEKRDERLRGRGR